MNPFQSLDDGFLAALREAFPDRLPASKTPIKEIRLRQGEQRVIAYLQQKLKEQQKDSATHVHVRQQQAT